MPEQSARAREVSELEARFRDAAFRRALTFDQAAQKCGTTGAWLRIQLRRRAAPTPSIVQGLAEFLELPVAEVLALHDRIAAPAVA